jgi:hypothetical protein
LDSQGYIEEDPQKQSVEGERTGKEKESDRPDIVQSDSEDEFKKYIMNRLPR